MTTFTQEQLKSLEATMRGALRTYHGVYTGHHWADGAPDAILQLRKIREALPSPENLRIIADYMDLFDKLLVKIANAQGESYTPGDSIQRDLRSLADTLEAQ